MEQIYPDLWQTPTENPLPGLYTHAFLLTRASGNVLFYNTGLTGPLDRMAALGGVRWQFLSHRDELGGGIRAIRERFGAGLGGHVNELDDFADHRTPDWVFDQREPGPEGIEIIPTPGHTPGSTSFLVDSPTGRRYLFTGDTLYFNRRRELDVAYFPGSSDAALYRDSLETLRSLDPDVVLSSACAGVIGYRAVTRQQWRESLDRAQFRLLQLSMPGRQVS